MKPVGPVHREFVSVVFAPPPSGLFTLHPWGCPRQSRPLQGGTGRFCLGRIRHDPGSMVGRIQPDAPTLRQVLLRQDTDAETFWIRFLWRRRRSSTRSRFQCRSRSGALCSGAQARARQMKS